MSPGNGMKRLFFASLPGPETSAQISATAAALQLDGAAQWVPRENYHSTLAFVGEVPASSVATLLQIGSAQWADGFTLRFDAYEYWPKPEVVVAAARVIPTALEQLWHRLHAALAAHQWAGEPKRLRPHITLARKVSRAPLLPAIPAFDWRVNKFALMCSEPSTHSAYTVVSTWTTLYDAPKT